MHSIRQKLVRNHDRSFSKLFSIFKRCPRIGFRIFCAVPMVSQKPFFLRKNISKSIQLLNLILLTIKFCWGTELGKYYNFFLWMQLYILLPNIKEKIICKSIRCNITDRSHRELYWFWQQRMLCVTREICNRQCVRTKSQ